MVAPCFSFTRCEADVGLGVGEPQVRPAEFDERVVGDAIGRLGHQAPGPRIPRRARSRAGRGFSPSSVQRRSADQRVVTALQRDRPVALLARRHLAAHPDPVARPRRRPGRATALRRADIAQFPIAGTVAARRACRISRGGRRISRRVSSTGVGGIRRCSGKGFSGSEVMVRLVRLGRTDGTGTAPAPAASAGLRGGVSLLDRQWISREEPAPRRRAFEFDGQPGLAGRSMRAAIDARGPERNFRGGSPKRRRGENTTLNGERDELRNLWPRSCVFTPVTGGRAGPRLRCVSRSIRIAAHVR